MDIKQPYISREVDRVAHEALKNIRRRHRYEQQVHQLNATKNLFAKHFEQVYCEYNPLLIAHAIQAGFKSLEKSGDIDAAIKAAEKHLENLAPGNAETHAIGYESANPHLLQSQK